MITKEEMEDIWNNKPIGYLKERLKKIKTTHNFIVNIEGVTMTVGPKERFLIRAKKADEAFDFAKFEYKKKHPNIKVDSWRYNARKETR